MLNLPRKILSSFQQSFFPEVALRRSKGVSDIAPVTFDWEKKFS